MRGVTDALRSVVRHTDLVLNEGPAPLGEVYSLSGRRFTHGGIAPGCVEVGERAWTWLRQNDLTPPEPVEAGGRRWERRRLLWPASDAALLAAGADPGGPVAASPSLLAPLAENLWEVRWAAERGEITYPFCRVNLTAGAATVPAAAYYSVTQPMSLECYPVDQAADPDEALLLATGVIDVLTRGFCGEGVAEGRMRRVPLYDYEAVPGTAGVSGRRNPSDFLSLEDWSSRTLPDPTDLRRCAAIVDLRVRWRASVNRHRGTTLVDSVNVVTAGS